MGGTTISTKAERINSVQLQQSSLGQPNPLIYGKTRVPTNLLWYGDFVAKAVTTTTESGKGGGVKQKNTTYEYYVAFQASFGHGVAVSVPTVWVGKQKFVGGATYSGTATVTELNSIPLTGLVKVSQYARIVSVQNVWACQAVNETADDLLTDGVEYSLVDGVLEFDLVGFPDLLGRAIRVAYTYSQTGLVSALAAAGIPFFATGGVGQAPYSYMTTKHPTQALGYSETALIGASAYRLDDSAQLPNHNFEVIGRLQYPGKDDANAADIVTDILTHPTSGANFPAKSLGDLAQFSNYCRAYGLFLSPAYTEQQEARTMLDELMMVCNSEVVWSEKVLKIIPYADTAKTANGATFTPNVTPIYDLDDRHFLVSGSEDPVKCRNKTPADAYNIVTIEILNRARDYNPEPVTAPDLASIEIHGPRPKAPMQAHTICDLAVGANAAQLALQRQLHITSTYIFKLSWQFCLLEPMDLVTITDVGLGLNKKPVRIIQIEESENGDLTFECEDFPSGVATATLYPTQGGTGYVPDYQVSPGNVVTPSLFEPPIEMAGKSGLEVWCAVTGSDPNWGGCTVWVSYDNISYSKVDVITGGARYGSLTGSITAALNQVAPVQLVGLGGTIVNASATDSANMATLSLIEDELVGYSSAALTGTNAYNVTLPNRGFFHTTPASHASSSRFVRIDDRIVKSGPLDYSMIGQTMYFKFTSFNIYQAAEQSLADVSAYSYTVRGNMVALPPSNVTVGSYVLEGYGLRVKWNKVADQDVDVYEIRVGGTDWATATKIAQVKGDNYLWAVQVAGTYTVRVRALDFFGNYSTADLVISAVIANPTASSLMLAFSGQDVTLNWSVVTGSFAIDRYEIRTGASWAAGTPVAIAYTNNYAERATFGGSKTYWVAAIDVAGNVSTPVSSSATVTNPATVTVSSEVIDNNVLLRWTDATASLPVVRYEIRKGATFAGGTVIGVESNTRFSAFFEQVGGTYTYWVQATDSAGNVSVAASVAVLVAQPPDYVLRLDFNSTFSGTKTNCFLQDGNLFACVDTTETFAAHFTTRSWAGPSAQISAGYPLYFQPSLTTGSYEETIDYGAVLPATGIAATIGYVVESGSVTITPKISVKTLVGDPWTDYAGQAQIVASNFRYVKITYDFTSTGGDDLIRITNINVKLSSKIRSDAGTGTAVSTDSGGTTVNFGVAFIDVTSIDITALSTSAVIAVYDFVDVPNPTSFKVLLFNTNGTRVSGPFSWSAKGI